MKLKITIPKEIIEYSHTGEDVKNNMNEHDVSQLLYIKTKYEHLCEFFDIKIEERD